MPDTLGVILEPRLGARMSGKRQRKWIGSDVDIWIDVRSVLTGQLVPNATGAAAWSRFYVASGDDAPDQPLEVTEPTPGTLHVSVPCDLPGTCDVGFQIEGPSRAAAHIVFDVASNGGITVKASGVIPYGDVQSVAVAAALSAVRPEARQLVNDYAVPAVNAAIDGAMDGLGEAAATAAVREVAGQLSGFASKTTVETLGREVDRKATTQLVDVLGRQVADKADAVAVQETTDDLGRRVGVLEQAGPGAAQLTALGIARAFGAPVYDFSDPRNSALLTF
jgi:hypothetical protein